MSVVQVRRRPVGEDVEDFAFRREVAPQRQDHALDREDVAQRLLPELLEDALLERVDEVIDPVEHGEERIHRGVHDQVRESSGSAANQVSAADGEFRDAVDQF